MKKMIIATALVLSLGISQYAFGADYMPNTQKTLQNIKGAINADIDAQKKKAQEEAAAKQKAREAEYQKKKAEQEAALKKKMEPAVQAQKDYEATKKDLENIKKRYSK